MPCDFIDRAVSRNCCDKSSVCCLLHFEIFVFAGLLRNCNIIERSMMKKLFMYFNICSLLHNEYLLAPDKCMQLAYYCMDWEVYKQQLNYLELIGGGGSSLLSNQATSHKQVCVEQHNTCNSMTSDTSVLATAVS